VDGTGTDSFHDQVCFHCQQSAEKYPKALLEELGSSVPRVHDLVQLFQLLISHHPELKAIKRGLLFLTTFAVAVRYPRFRSTKRRAAAAVRWAERTREKCRQLLGIQPKPR